MINPFFVASGGLLIVLAAAHILWGRKQPIFMPPKDEVNRLATASFSASWYENAIGLLVLGLALIGFTLFAEPAVARPVALLALFLVVGDLVGFAILTMMHYRWLKKLLSAQVAIFVGMICLLVLGLRSM